MKFRKKPVVIEAIQFTGDAGNVSECFAFCQPLYMETYRCNDTLTIPTLEGKMICSKGDWIIKGINGEFYPCKPDVFEKTYEPVKDGDDT